MVNRITGKVELIAGTKVYSIKPSVMEIIFSPPIDMIESLIRMDLKKKEEAPPPPPPSSEQIKNVFERIAGEYDEKK